MWRERCADAPSCWKRKSSFDKRQMSDSSLCLSTLSQQSTLFILALGYTNARLVLTSFEIATKTITLWEKCFRPFNRRLAGTSLFDFALAYTRSFCMFDGVWTVKIFSSENHVRVSFCFVKRFFSVFCRQRVSCKCQHPTAVAPRSVEMFSDRDLSWLYGEWMIVRCPSRIWFLSGPVAPTKLKFKYHLNPEIIVN